MPDAARVSDNHTCPKCEPGPVPHVGGPILPEGSPDIEINFLRAVRAGLDKCFCAAGGPDPINQGCGTVFFNNMPAVRMTDTTGHGGIISTGSNTVEIGVPGDGVKVAVASDLSGAGFPKKDNDKKDNDKDTKEECQGSWINKPIPYPDPSSFGDTDWYWPQDPNNPFLFYILIPLDLVLYGQLECKCKLKGNSIKTIDLRKKVTIAIPEMFPLSMLILPGVGGAAREALAIAKAAALRAKITILTTKIANGVISADQFVHEYAPFLKAGLDTLWNSGNLICEGLYNPEQLWSHLPSLPGTSSPNMA